MLIFLGCLLFTIVMHELGHMISALICGVRVEAFSIGFGKPYLHKKIKGIDFRLTPWLIGGYCQLGGEEDNTDPEGFLVQKYSKKALILISGVTVNFLIAFLCYLINYNSIRIGLYIDFMSIGAMFSGDYSSLLRLVIGNSPNLFLWQLSLINIFCALSNLLPIPALDGGWLWMALMEKPLGKNFLNFLRRVNFLFFITLMYLQFILLIFIYVR